jgi:hypothetical protein
MRSTSSLMISGGGYEIDRVVVWMGRGAIGRSRRHRETAAADRRLRA